LSSRFGTSSGRVTVTGSMRGMSMRALRAASASTLRIDSSSASRSRVISDSVSGGSSPRSCATSAVRARS
jgi:hypothetical protein